MNNYIDLLDRVLSDGTDTKTRNGIRRTIFRHQLKYDLREDFPIVTTKKVFWRGITTELCWFLNGDTNTKYLTDRGIHIWDGNADENGECGPIYGHAWRNFGGRPNAIVQPKPTPCENNTYLGIADGTGKEGHILKKTWEGMISRCYDKNNISYQYYGGKGVYVCNRWLNFLYFAEDSKYLYGWERKKKYPKEYTLDKDGIGNGFLYSPEHCQWVSCAENSNLKNRYIYTVQKESTGQLYHFSNPTQFCKDHFLEGKNFSDLWTGSKNAKIRNGFTFIEKKDRWGGIDQINNLIFDLINNPNSTRHVVTAWNPQQQRQMALPPCHFAFHCHVENKSLLHMEVFLRSSDVALGLPFNISSYALLLHILAMRTQYTAGKLWFNLGNVHLYQEHWDLAEEQIMRKPFPLPRLEIQQPITYNLKDLNPESFVLRNYQYHSAIPYKLIP